MYKQIIGATLAVIFVAPALAADNIPVRTVAQIYAEQAELSTKHIHLVGKVVKVNNDIMGKNFLHIQDGTGEDGTNDIILSSQQTADIGDEVAIDALVTTNRDFGSGYSYPVILEEATISKISH